jgi:hypothetical protein
MLEIIRNPRQRYSASGGSTDTGGNPMSVPMAIIILIVFGLLLAWAESVDQK